MMIINIFKRVPLAITILAAAFLASQNASARSLVFNATPVSDAVAQIDQELGIHIVLKSGVDPNTLVSFSVNDVSAPGAQLDAVNNLANAVGADYQKTFVISKVIADSAVVIPKIDSDAPVVFRQTTLAAQDAIDLIAAVDNAQVRYYTPILGNVTMSGQRLSAIQAAREIAEQTHTQWKAYYGISPRRKDRTDGAIIGYTAGGRPILELPLITFRVPAPPPPVVTASTTAKPATTPATAADGATGALAPAAALANGVFPYPTGYDQYGYPSGYANPYVSTNPNVYYSPYGGPVIVGGNVGNGIIFAGPNSYGLGGGPIIIGNP